MTNNSPDAVARGQALDIKLSFLVQAPAGSGKTELLTQRFLKLLSLVESPEEIVAITFTNKAAAEMRSRIVEALIKAKTLKIPDRDHEKITWTLAQRVLQRSEEKNWHLQEHPNRLKILTLDALALQIAQKLPVSSKLGAQLDISDDPETLYRQAAKIILLSPPKNAPWLQHIQALLLYLDNNYFKLETLLAELLAKRDQWLPLMMFGKDNREKIVFLENELKHVNEYILKLGETLLPTELKKEINSLATYAAIPLNWTQIADMLLTKSDELRKKADKNIGFPAPSSSRNHAEKSVFQEYKNRYDNLVNNLKSHPDFIHWLIEVRYLPKTEYSLQQKEILTAIFTLLPLTAAQLRLIFSQTGKTDYIENAQSALHALGDNDHPTDLSLQLDYSIQHLLVDEFQDTSNNQFQLLEKLTAGWSPDDGRTLFLVGDPMQSIYRFRQAEVGLFLHAKHHGIGKILLQFITLSSNFRSSSQIVNWLNDTFKNIFPKKEEISLGAIPYSRAHPIHAEKQDSAVKCQVFSKKNMGLEEQYIVDTLQQLKKTVPQETIAILIRSRDHLKNITPLLKNLDIEYQAIDIESLSHKPIIQDLLSLTRAYLHLGDRVAWLACLRAPWCGLTLHDLWIIAHASTEETIWSLINDGNIVEQLFFDSQQRLLHFQKTMSFAIQQRHRISLRDIIEKAWQDLNGEKLLKNHDELRDIEQFLSALENMNDSTAGVQLEKLEKKVRTLFAATTPARNNPVQIMTIHKAKGLEFDHVFLPKLDKKPAFSKQPLINWLEYADENNRHHLLMSPLSEINKSDCIYDYIQQQQQKKILLEMDRLLYVAATRAKKCLYLTASLDLEKLSPSTQSLLGRAWKSIHYHYDAIKNNSENNLIQENHCHSLKRLAIDELKKAIKGLPYSPDQKNTPELILSSQKEEAKFGIIIHLLIERIAEYGICWWQSIGIKQQKKIIYALTQQFNLSTNSNSIYFGINNMINDPRGQWILKKRTFSFSEYMLHHQESKVWSKKIIDRIFQDENGEYWIIDFKTSANIAQAAAQYTEQLHGYQKAFKHLVGEVKIHLALYFPLLPAWYVFPH